jgi:outer membrane immunogenic protein
MIWGAPVRKLLSITALVAFAAIDAAGAADLPAAPAYKAPVVAPVSYYNWSGFYIGVNAGYGWGDDAVALSGDPSSLFLSGLTTGVFPATIATNPRGFAGGGQIGWNYQAGSFVFGLEADADAADIKSSGTVVGTIGIPRTLAGSQRLDWLSTFRARLGVTPTDRLLLYVTGGGAAGRANASVSVTTNDLGGVAGSGCIAGTCESAALSGTLWGWSAGGGVEYAVGGNWSLRAEYLHYDLGSLNLTAADPRFPAGVNVTNASAHFRGEIVRAGVNYKFDWGGPVVARY